MTRLRCLGLCACFVLSLTAIACGSSNSGPPTWDQSRIANTGFDWWLNGQKGADYFSFDVTNTAGGSDCTMFADVITFSNAVLAKYKSGAAPLSMVPTSGEVSGWTYDPSVAKSYPNPGVATDATGAQDLIDGGAAAFFTSSYSATGFAWENYISGTTYKLELQIWQMASVANATQVYGDLPTSSALYSNATFTTVPATCPSH
jgi:hypothetical protein